MAPERSRAPSFLVNISRVWYPVGGFGASPLVPFPSGQRRLGHAHFQSASCLQSVLCCGVRDGWPSRSNCASAVLHLFFPADTPLGLGWSWLRAAASREGCHLMSPSFCLSYISFQLLNTLNAISNWMLVSVISLPVFAVFFFFSYLEHCGR